MQAAGTSLSPTVASAVKHGSSKALRDYKLQGPILPKPKRQITNEKLPHKGNAGGASDSVLQKRFGTAQPGELGQFDGGSEADNATVSNPIIVPPDTNGDVGPNHYVQFINLIFNIYDKTGTLVQGPIPGNAPFEGFGGPCEVNNDGDPMVKYDRAADRWVLTQFAIPNYPDGPSYQCFAVSKTGDPTGEYWLYQFTIGSLANGWGDYPKLGVWPDGYYIAFNMFTSSSFAGMGCYAFDRTSMLNGDPATAISFQPPNDGGGLPSDLDGPTPPPDGTPNYYMTWWNNSPGSNNIYQFHVDWATPANSTFTGPVNFPVADWLIACGGSFGACVPQLGSTEVLDTLSDRLMNRLAYRNFGDHESLVTNQTVATPDGKVAVRWYEFRDPGGTPTVYQQGTYAPDSSFRWMASIAMDQSGNMALGYSKSSSTEHPSIGITGRLAGDPLGTMGAEDVFFSGAGSQQASFNRWGDYSSMSIDPTDDCTFWYTQEYYATTTDFDFKTRVGSFKFPSCGAPSGTIEGTVTGAGTPLVGATVAATPSPALPAVQTYTTTTDGSGHYSLLIPVGVYDMTASKYGYGSASANGVPTSDGGDTVQNFSLTPSLTVQVNGVVKDGSGQGWPLLARVDILPGPGGFPGATVYTDPVTGYYTTNLVAGLTYDFVVTSVGPGYVPGGGSVFIPVPSAAPGAVVVNWTLVVNASCSAPGYISNGTGPAVLNEGFDAGTLPTGWSIVTTGGPGWQIVSGADPCNEFPGNLTGGSGPYALLNSNNNDGDCAFNSTDNSSLITPALDLSALPNAALTWANDYNDLSTSAQVDVSVDGGATWTNVWDKSGVDVRGPGTQFADISVAAGHAGVKARFHFQGTWGWWWQVDNVVVAPAICTPVSGGVVVGTVSDSNTSLGLNGAVVANQPQPGSPTATTANTPSQGDGYYSMFVGSGSQSFEASKSGYASLTKNITVVPNSVSRLDFSLLAGKLAASPSPISSVIPTNSIDSAHTLTLTNTGTGSAGFQILEVNSPPVVSLTSGFVSEKFIKEIRSRVPVAERAKEKTLRTGKNLPPMPNPPHRAKPKFAWAGGDVLASYDTDIPYAWGVGYGKAADSTYLSNLYFYYGGDNGAYQYDSNGALTGNVIDLSPTGSLFITDGAFNDRTGMVWFADGTTSCIYETNPTTKIATGNSICPDTGSVGRGLAYDAVTDTYFVGSWFDGSIFHFDASGTILDSAFVGLGVSGLAYFPASGHLFVQVSDFVDFSITVLDAHNNYEVVGNFFVSDGAFDDHGGAGMEADCEGNLWMVNQFQQKIYKVASGEGATCVIDVPWVSEDPTSGIVPGLGVTHPSGEGTNPFPINVSFDSTGLLPGLRQAQLKIKTDTPYAVPNVPVNLTVLFDDVPQGSFAWNFIYGAAGAGIMRGCDFYLFCPNALVTRADMAGYIERAIHGPQTPPPVYQGGFQDVFFNAYNADYIQGLVDDQITAGCSLNPPLFCPDAAIPREQMAVFILLGKHGSDYVPPDCETPIFDDVPCDNNFAPWVNELFNEGITAGCSVTPALFCPRPDPNNPIPNNGLSTNAQMAVFMSTAFNLPHVP